MENYPECSFRMGYGKKYLMFHIKKICNIRESVVGGIILTLERRVLFVKTKRNMNRVKMRMAVWGGVCVAVLLACHSENPGLKKHWRQQAGTVPSWNKCWNTTVVTA